MKLMKEMKKLKFWSSKKRKKDNYYYHKLPQYDFYPYVYHPPPPSPPRLPPPRPPLPEGCQCHFCLPAEPAAPPLPAWIDCQLQQGISGDSNSINSFLNSSKEHEEGDHCIRISQETVVKTASTSITTTAAATSSGQLQGKTEIIDFSSSALQQCSPSREKDAAGGLLGCVVDVGALLFRCFHSCLHISERHRPYHYNSSSLPHKALIYQNMEKKTY